MHEGKVLLYLANRRMSFDAESLQEGWISGDSGDNSSSAASAHFDKHTVAGKALGSDYELGVSSNFYKFAKSTSKNTYGGHDLFFATYKDGTLLKYIQAAEDLADAPTTGAVGGFIGRKPSDRKSAKTNQNQNKTPDKKKTESAEPATEPESDKDGDASAQQSDKSTPSGTDRFVKYRWVCDELTTSQRGASIYTPIYEIVAYKRSREGEPLIITYFLADAYYLNSSNRRYKVGELPESEKTMSGRVFSTAKAYCQEYVDSKHEKTKETVKEFDTWAAARKYFGDNEFVSRIEEIRYGEVRRTENRKPTAVKPIVPEEQEDYWVSKLSSTSGGAISGADAASLAHSLGAEGSRDLCIAITLVRAAGGGSLSNEEACALARAFGGDEILRRNEQGKLRELIATYVELLGDVKRGDATIGDVLSLIKDEGWMTRLPGRRYLTEANRQQLLSKSRGARQYKDTSKGRTRYERRMKSQISATVRDYNNIEMDQLFKRDVFEMRIPVIGETDVYEVHIKVDGVINEIHRQVQTNQGRLEFKVVLQSLMRAINLGDVYIGCTCPDFRYRQRYWATQHDYVAGGKETRPSNHTNPHDDLGAACKHGLLILANLDWCIKVASVINNYVKYCQTHLEQAYAEYIFPKIYGIKYDKAVQMNLFYNGFLPQDKATRDEITRQSLLGRDAHGKFSQDNQYKFRKGETVSYPEDNPDQLKLNLDSPAKSLSADAGEPADGNIANS